MEKIKQNKSILIVDDNKSILEVLDCSLDEKGFKTYTALNAEAALKLCPKYYLEYALIDVRLPGLNGIELSKKIVEFYPEIIIILMTGYPDINTVLNALRARVYDYLIKPFKIEQVLKIINQAHREKSLIKINKERNNQIKLMQQEIVDLRKKNDELTKLIDEKRDMIIQNKDLKKLAHNSYNRQQKDYPFNVED